MNDARVNTKPNGTQRQPTCSLSIRCIHTPPTFFRLIPIPRTGFSGCGN